MNPKIPEIYSNRPRLRVCGLCWKGDKLLMVNHRQLTAGSFWAPPGGGVEFGEPVADALVREFLEETHVKILPAKFKFVCEFIQPPLHAVELFFEVDYQEGEASLGTDPESNPEDQLINAVRYMSIEEILSVPSGERHGIFRFIKTTAEVKKLTGFYRI
jgi:8-oxo-dGTP diphosphatase